RDGMRALLPESIRARGSKTLFGSVLQREVAEQWPLYEQVFGPAGRSEIAKRGYVDRELIWTRLLELRDGIARPDVVYLIQIVGLETWLRTFRLARSRLVTTASRPIGRPSHQPLAPTARRAPAFA